MCSIHLACTLEAKQFITAAARGLGQSSTFLTLLAHLLANLKASMDSLALQGRAGKQSLKVRESPMYETAFKEALLCILMHMGDVKEQPWRRSP